MLVLVPAYPKNPPGGKVFGVKVRALPDGEFDAAENAKRGVLMVDLLEMIRGSEPFVIAKSDAVQTSDAGHFDGLALGRDRAGGTFGTMDV